MNITFVIPNMDHYRCFFLDMNDNEKVVVLGKSFSLIKRVEKLFYKKAEIPNGFYNATNLFFKKKINLESTDILVFTDLSQKKLPKGFVKWLKQKYSNIKFVMLFYNKVSTLYDLNGNIDMTYLPEKDVMLPFDKIYSYDMDEVKQFGFEFYVVLSNVSKYLGETNQTTLHDVFYCGSVGANWKKGRYYEIDRIYRYLTSNSVDCDFHLVCGKGIDLPECIYAKHMRIPYLDMINRIMESKVILDVVSNNKIGISPRFYDALMYNKKYLTNNKAILEHPYYNPQYMRVYNDLSDIDFEWIRNSEKADYKYDEYFTPDGFYNKMVELYGVNLSKG